VSIDVAPAVAPYAARALDDPATRRAMRRKWRITAAFAITAVVGFLLAALILVVAHEREAAFRRHAVVAEADVTGDDNPFFADFAIDDRYVAAPVHVDVEADWQVHSQVAILVDRIDPTVVRIPGQTSEFVGQAGFYAEQWAIGIGTCATAIAALALVHVLRRRRVLARHPWRHETLRAEVGGGYRGTSGEHDGVVKILSFGPYDRVLVDIAGPRRAGRFTHSVIRRVDDPKLRWARGPRPRAALVPAELRPRDRHTSVPARPAPHVMSEMSAATFDALTPEWPRDDSGPRRDELGTLDDASVLVACSPRRVAGVPISRRHAVQTRDGRLVGWLQARRRGYELLDAAGHRVAAILYSESRFAAQVEDEVVASLLLAGRDRVVWTTTHGVTGVVDTKLHDAAGRRCAEYRDRDGRLQSINARVDRGTSVVSVDPSLEPARRWLALLLALTALSTLTPPA
jgi:hypothetical protein